MCKTGSENRAGQKRADVTRAQQEGISELFNKTPTREQDITHGITDTSDGSRKATSHDKQSKQDTSIKSERPKYASRHFSMKKKKNACIFLRRKNAFDLEQHEDRQELMTGFFNAWLNCSFLSFSLLVHHFAVILGS